jgi:methionyl-tRNA synthetase
MSDNSRIMITSALPYANGPLHFGHLTGVYLPADVFYRHLKQLGKNVAHISGSDEHGVAIMLNAQKAKVPYKEYVDQWHREHKELFDRYQVQFDFFGQTSAAYHADETIKWFKEINKKGLVETQDSPQLQCQDCHNHLPDRFVMGECYSCHYPDARGDECPNCGIIIDSVRLINPVCQICQSKNIKKVTVTQYYLMLSKCHKQFRQWFDTKRDSWRKTVWPYVDSLTKESLQDRAISRDLDWGIDVPLPEAKGKKFYVWFDAPIGYVSNTKEWLRLKASKDDYLKDWWANPETKTYHFIGKDNIIFHCIIFPVMGMASSQILPPYDVPANQYLNLKGKQFSKSSGWYVDAKGAIEQFGSSALRYYLLAILPEGSDSSFTWEGFQARINGELANNVGNLVNRCLKFLKKNWPEGIESSVYAGWEKEEWALSADRDFVQIKASLDQVEIRRGLELAMLLGQKINTYFSDQAPWAQFKTDQKAAAATISKTSLQILLLASALSPFLPELSRQVFALFGLENDGEFQSKLYQKGLKALAEKFGSSIKVLTEPQALVPKIEDTVIAALEAELALK